MAHRLLLADDSVTIQRVIELTFAEEGVEVVSVGDGLEAIERLGTEPFDIVLADVGMPGKDGFEVAAFVRSRPRLAGVAVVLLTGAFDALDEARVAEVGAAAVLVKPFEPQMVIAKVRDLLSGRPATETAAAADALLAAPPAAHVLSRARPTTTSTASTRPLPRSTRRSSPAIRSDQRGAAPVGTQSTRST